MQKFGRIAILLAVVLSIAVAYLIIRRWTANDMEKRLTGDAPFGIELLLQDEDNNDSVEGLAQVIVFPAHKELLLYAVNTDAYDGDSDKPLRELSPGKADILPKYTEVDNKYYIKFKKKSLVRFFDLMGGLDLFMDEPMILKDSLFQYPQGAKHFSGDQVVDFMLRRRLEKDPTRLYLTGVDRVYRMESILLSLFYRLNEAFESVKPASVWSVVSSLPDTNMNSEELKSLFQYIAKQNKVQMATLEAPLEELPLQLRAPDGSMKKLQVKDKRARLVYREFMDNMEGNRLNTDLFLLEILNGTETSGLARRVKQFIQDRDLLVLDTDNYPYKPLPHSLILERSGNTYRARRLRDLTGLKNGRVFFLRRPLDVDASLILGDDFNMKKLQVF